MSGWVPENFQALFREHFPTVVRKIYGLVGDRQTAEDLAQETFLKLYRNPPDDLAYVGAWLHRVLTNATYDYMRQKARRLAMEEQEQRLSPQDEAVARSNEQIVIQKWERDVVNNVLQKLSKRDREALVMKEQGYSYAEIAERLQVNPKIVGPLLMRASERFKKNAANEEASTDERTKARTRP